MSTAAIGLFENTTSAREALQQLINAGFSQVDVELIGRGNGFLGNADIFRHLRQMGVPEEEVNLYSKHVEGGKALVAVKTIDAEVAKAEAVLEQNGAQLLDDIDDAPTSILESRPNPTTAIDNATANTGSEQTTIPVIEEELEVGKRNVTRRRVRIYPRIVEVPVEESVNLRQEHINVERHPIDRPAEASDYLRLREGTLELTEGAEEPVVQKSARVVEEVVLSKNVEQENRTIRDKVRKTEVGIDEGDIAARGAYAGRSANSVAPNSNLTGGPNTTTNGELGGATSSSHSAPIADAEYADAYGTKLASDPRYKGKDWQTVEPYAQQEWGTHQKGAWEEFKDMIRHAWEKVSGER